MSGSPNEVPKFVQEVATMMQQHSIGPKERVLVNTREVINFYLDSLTYIPFHAFLHDLWVVFANFLNTHDLNECVFFDDTSRSYMKSTTWLLYVFRDFVHRFTGQIMKTLPVVRRKGLESKAPNKVVVCIDDFMYSGHQMSRSVTAVRKIQGVRKVVLLIPYVGGRAYKNMWGYFKKKPLEPDVELFHVRRFDTFKEILARERPHLTYKDPNHIPVFLDHKVPDDVSVWEPLTCAYVKCSSAFYNDIQTNKFHELFIKRTKTTFTAEQKRYLLARNVEVSSIGRMRAYKNGWSLDDLFATDARPLAKSAVDMKMTRRWPTFVAHTPSDLYNKTPSFDSPSQSNQTPPATKPSPRKTIAETSMQTAADVRSAPFPSASRGRLSMRTPLSTKAFVESVTRTKK